MEHLLAGKVTAEAVKASVEKLKTFEGEAKKLVEEERDKRDDRSALLLYNAGMVYQSMRTHAAGCRLAYSPWRTFSPDWLHDEKKNAWDNLQQFINEHEIYPRLQQALPALDDDIEWLTGSRLHPLRTRLYRKTLTSAKELAATGHSYLDEVAMPIRIQKLKPEAWINHEEVFSGGDAEVVRHKAEVMLDIVENRGNQVLDAASKAFGGLQHDVLRRYRRLAKWQPVLLTLGATRTETMQR